MSRVYKEYEVVETILDDQDSKDRVRKIQSALNAEEKRLRAKYPFLNYYNTIAILTLVVTLAIMAGMAFLYLNKLIPWWVASIVCGVCIGFHHEIEHDIIHNLYFKNNKLVQDLLFVIVFITKIHIPPWIRRITHWKHHRISGQINDVEERFVGMGEPIGLRRMILSLHPATVYNQVSSLKNDAPQFDFQAATNASAGPFSIWQIITKTFIIYQVILYVCGDSFSGIHAIVCPLFKNLMVLWIIPSTIRSTAIIVLTTNAHYYMDIPKNNLFYQCQILNHPIFYMFAIFTCDFGATHIVHHYNALQPYFIRQLCRGVALEEMRKQGVRINDWGVLLRQNRFHRKPEDASKEKIVFFIWIFFLVTCAPLWIVLGDIIFLTKFIKDLVTRQSLASAKGSVEVDNNDNTEVRAA